MTVKRILNNPAYVGKTYYGMSRRVGKTRVIAQPRESWILLPNITPPIITEEMFKLAHESTATGKASRRVKPNASYLLTSFVRCSKCGSPVIGTKLNNKYRYYRCRGATPTTTRDRICDAGYMKAEVLESSVWDKVLDMLSSPLTLLRTLIDEKEDHSREIIHSLNKDIAKLRKSLKTYPRKERTLYDLLANDAVTKDYVLDAASKLKQQRLNDERQLKLLLLSRKEATQSDHLKLTLTQASAKRFMGLVYEYDWKSMPLYPYPHDVEDHEAEQLNRKRRLFESIRLNVLAEPTSYEFTFALDGTIISTKYSDELASLEGDLEDFQERHPDIPIKDLLDTSKGLPQDVTFAQKVNKLKQDLVTIERTSG